MDKNIASLALDLHLIKHFLLLHQGGLRAVRKPPWCICSQIIAAVCHKAQLERASGGYAEAIALKMLSGADCRQKIFSLAREQKSSLCEQP